MHDEHDGQLSAPSLSFECHLAPRKDLESAKIKERDAKHRQLAAHLTLSQAKMEANLAEQEHNVDLKERQQSVMHAVASTEKNLVRARLLAAESSIKDSKLKRKL